MGSLRLDPGEARLGADRVRVHGALRLLTGYLGGFVDGVSMQMIDPTLVIASQTSWIVRWQALAIFRVVPSFNLLGDGLGGLLDSYRS